MVPNLGIDPKWIGKSTKILLWSTESIGYHTGYYECKLEQLDIHHQYLDGKINSVELDEGEDRIERKYFGPKYVPLDKNHIPIIILLEILTRMNINDYQSMDQ